MHINRRLKIKTQANSTKITPAWYNVEMRKCKIHQSMKKHLKPLITMIANFM